MLTPSPEPHGIAVPTRGGPLADVPGGWARLRRPFQGDEAFRGGAKGGGSKAQTGGAEPGRKRLGKPISCAGFRAVQARHSGSRIALDNCRYRALSCQPRSALAHPGPPARHRHRTPTAARSLEYIDFPGLGKPPRTARAGCQAHRRRKLLRSITVLRIQTRQPRGARIPPHPRSAYTCPTDIMPWPVGHTRALARSFTPDPAGGRVGLRRCAAPAAARRSGSPWR